MRRPKPDPSLEVATAHRPELLTLGSIIAEYLRTLQGKLVVKSLDKINIKKVLIATLELNEHKTISIYPFKPLINYC